MLTPDSYRDSKIYAVKTIHPQVYFRYTICDFRFLYQRQQLQLGTCCVAIPACRQAGFHRSNRYSAFKRSACKNNNLSQALLSMFT